MTRDKIIASVARMLAKEECATLWYALDHMREIEREQLRGDGRARALQAFLAEKRALVRLQVRATMGERKGDVRGMARRVAIVDSAINKLTEGA